MVNITVFGEDNGTGFTSWNDRVFMAFILAGTCSRTNPRAFGGSESSRGQTWNDQRGRTDWVTAPSKERLVMALVFFVAMIEPTAVVGHT
jgi:hypothetical protein